VSTLRDLVEEHTGLGEADIDHLHRLAGDWQLLSDLSFADLLMWVPVRGEDGQPRRFLCVAQVRPTTAPTAYQDDQVGKIVGGPEVAHLDIAFTQERIWREGDPVWYGDTPARHEAIPVRLRDETDRDECPTEVIAVIGRDTNLSTARTPSQLELNYLTTADDLAQMVADGTFPPPRHPGETTSAPRVIAHLVGEELSGLTSRLAADPLEGTDAAERILASLRGESPPRQEVDARGATVLTRALPLMPAGVPIGALVLVRDVTEVRRRDRALMTKDATIREIHHRVKNNLQTVAALLRLQARRVDLPEARMALQESVRRVASIALVHETLSMSNEEAVEFDGIVDRVASAATEVAATNFTVKMRREGTFGVLPAEIATSLVMVLNELLINAVEHGFPAPDDEDSVSLDAPRAEVGEVVVSAHRFRKQLHVTVADNGQGLPEGFVADSNGRLGLQIVRALATGELRGTIELRNRAGGGTEAVLVVPLGKR
jgi:two-component sensor histidine kinase